MPTECHGHGDSHHQQRPDDGPTPGILGAVQLGPIGLDVL